MDFTDDAASSDLYHEAKAKTENIADIVDRVLCLNHINMHCQTSTVVSVFGHNPVHSLFSLSVYLALSTYFLRCILKLHAYLKLDGVVEILHAPPTEFDL